MSVGTRKQVSSLTLLVIGVLILTSRPAHAYIDPGTGSFVLQAAIAGLLGAAFVIKSTWKNLTQAIARVFSRKDSRAG
jgi:hydrogenase-4 membrane subunit HyfE